MKPSTKVASLLNFCPKASLRLCAGSVDISKTDSLTLLSCTASEHDVVVLPIKEKKKRKKKGFVYGHSQKVNNNKYVCTFYYIKRG